ncbi:hypothetical protein M1394_01050 [Candidatus Marsarchaeota archaeon]|nr:hypothetical protein [Candidatus Marsarchaeota archaeon]
MPYETLESAVFFGITSVFQSGIEIILVGVSLAVLFVLGIMIANKKEDERFVYLMHLLIGISLGVFGVAIAFLTDYFISF